MSEIDTPSPAASDVSDEPVEPVIVSGDHAYVVLPVEKWPLAYRFIADHVDPDTPVPTSEDNNDMSILVAIDPETMQIRSVAFVETVIRLSPPLSASGAVVDPAAFERLLSAYLPPETVYYVEVDATAEVVVRRVSGVDVTGVVGEAGHEDVASEGSGRDDADSDDADYGAAV